MMTVRPFTPDDTPAVVRLWNGCAARGELLYRPQTEKSFAETFLRNEHYEPGFQFVAETEDGALAGFVSGCRKRVFLPGQTEQNTPGYLTALFVDAPCRRQGIGGALTDALESAFRAVGKAEASVSSNNPVNLAWIVPGTPGHEHNNAPGADEEGMGYPFLLARGYIARVHEEAMYLNLADYVKSPIVEEKRHALAQRGIIAGLYDPKRGCEFDTMCDRVGSEYWRKVLADELSAARPRPILAATDGARIVGFTGPADKEPSGRGWFTGICTDPEYEKLGIATVLFNDLMGEFIKLGAEYSTLFTGMENHAQRLYLRTGFRPARHFAILTKKLEA